MNAPSILPDEDPAMRMPRVRFTVRGMMAAVAVVCLALCFEQMRRKRSLYFEEAGVWSQIERRYLEEATDEEADAAAREEALRRYKRALAEVGRLSAKD